VNRPAFPTRAKGRPCTSNIYRDAYEDIAEHISRQIQHSRARHVVQVRPDGGVRVVEASRLTADDYTAIALDASYIGTYTQAVRVEQIEDDLLHWLRYAKAA
jgi:hypothetical protein